MISTANDVTRRSETPTKARRCTFNRKTNTIDIQVTPGYIYQIDLDECATSQGVLDWIHQIHQKAWGPEIMEEFLELIFDHIPSKLWRGV